LILSTIPEVLICLLVENLEYLIFGMEFFRQVGWLRWAIGGNWGRAPEFISGKMFELGLPVWQSNTGRSIV
jgi:hypothetical protein